MTDKVSTLIGFSVKANKVIFGADELKEGKRKRYLIVGCHTLSERSLKEVKRIAARDKVPLAICVKKELSDIVFKRNCKVIGICDKQMSEAIMKFINTEDYLIIESEEI